MVADSERCEQGAALYPGPRPLDEDHPLMLAQKEDLQALGGVFLELVFSSLGSAGPSESTSGPALQRLLVEVFKGNIDEFRCVCLHANCCTSGIFSARSGSSRNLTQQLRQYCKAFYAGYGCSAGDVLLCQ